MPENLEKKDQIPTEFNEDQTIRAVRKQESVPGEGREKTVNDFAQASSVGRVLKDLEFPADKNDIVGFVQRQASPEGNEVLPLLQKIEEKQYESVFDVTSAAKLVQ